jgi:hypothetical protein
LVRREPPTLLAVGVACAIYQMVDKRGAVRR